MGRGHKHAKSALASAKNAVRGALSPPRRVLGPPVDARGLVIDAVSHSIEELPETEISDFFSWIEKYAARKERLYPPSLVSQYSGLWPVKYFTFESFSSAIRWTALFLSNHRDTLAQYVIALSSLEKSVFSNDGDTAIGILNQIEKRFGLSLWLIELRIFVLKKFKGLETQKAYVSAVLGAAPNSLPSFLAAYTDLLDQFAAKFHSRLWTLDYYDSADTGWADRLRAKTAYIKARADQSGTIQFQTDLCVITGLRNPELTALRSLKWDWRPPRAIDEVGYYYEGSFASGGAQRSVVAAAAPRMGMVASALLTMKMILKFRPRLLAMVGICAGVKNECYIGDVLVADPAWDWQMGKYTTGKFASAPDPIDIPTAIAERFAQLEEDKQLWFDVHASFNGTKPRELPTVRVGPVTSGSAVLADGRLLKEIKEQHRKLLGVEMELYGVYVAARDCSPPNPIAFGIKSVSDYADDTKDDDYQPYASHAVRELLRRSVNVTLMTFLGCEQHYRIEFM